MHQSVVALAVAAHFVLVAYLVVGGFIALRWRRTIWLHIPVVVWRAVLYPVGWVGAVQVAVFVVIAVSWALYVWRAQVARDVSRASASGRAS